MMSRLLQKAEEEEYEYDEDEEYESHIDDEEEKDSNADEQSDAREDEEENYLEQYLRKRGFDESRLRARTAPLRPME